MRSIRLVAMGLNYKTAPVEVREKFSLSEEQIRAGLENLGDFEPLQEAVILSTCNRSEIYIAADISAGAVDACRAFWAYLTGTEQEIASYKDYIYTFIDDACIHHLFQVTSSLDSLVLGEGQILCQVKHAYALAKECSATSTSLNLLFHKALTTGKRVRTETRIAFNSVSISYAAVEMAKGIFQGLGRTNALVLGAGKMSALTAKHLASHGVNQLIIANRHVKRAEELAKKVGGSGRRLSTVFQEMREQELDIDIIVTSTGATDYVVRKEDLAPYMEHRTKPLVVIDIAVPRDVEPAVAELPGVTLYDIDDLESVIDEHKHEREQEAVQAEEIIVEEMEALLDRYTYLPMQPVLEKLSQRAELIRQREVKRALTKLPDLSEYQLKQIEHMSSMIIRKMLRVPMMKVSASAGKDYESFFVRALTSLYELD